MCVAFALVIFSLLAQASLETRSRWSVKPFWRSSEERQEEGILDAVLFRQALYGAPDRELTTYIVEPTAPHTHSVFVMHGLYNVAPHTDHIINHWAPRHPGIRWFLPQATGVDRNGFGVPGWYNPWIGGSWGDHLWAQVSDDLYNSTIGEAADVSRIDLHGEYGDANAYSSPRFWEDEHGVVTSCRRLWHILMTQVIGDAPGKVSWDKLIITGFSQGGFMTLVLATTMPHLAAGYQVYSGYLPLRTHPHRLAFNAPAANISWVHGTNDELFRPPLVQYSLNVLKKLGYRDITFTWEMGMGHWFGPLSEQTASMDRLIARLWGPGV